MQRAATMFGLFMALAAPPADAQEAPDEEPSATALEEPVVEEPAVEEPVSEDPVVEEPADEVVPPSPPRASIPSPSTVAPADAPRASTLLASSDVGFVVGSTFATCAACFATPVALAGVGCLATFLLTSAGSPCAAVMGGTAAALYAVGGTTCVGTPLLFGPAAGTATSAAAGAGALYVASSWRSALPVLAGALPGFLVGLASFAGIGLAAAGALVIVATLGAMGSSMVLSVLIFPLALLAASTFVGGLAGPLVVAGVTASALAHSELVGGAGDGTGRNENAGRDVSSGPALCAATQAGGAMSF